MDSTLIILDLNNELNLDDFQGYLQGPSGNLTHHETPRANFRPRVHGVSRELTFDPVCTGVKRPVYTGCPEISWTPWAHPLDLIDMR